MSKRVQVSVPALPDGEVYIVMGPGAWGRDKDFAVALKNAKKAFGAGRDWRYIVYAAHETVRVDAMGSFVWVPDEVGGDEQYQHNPYREVVRVGFPEPKPPKPWDSPETYPLVKPPPGQY